MNIKCGDKDTFSDLCLSGVRASLGDDLAIFVSKLASGSGVNDAFLEQNSVCKRTHLMCLKLYSCFIERMIQSCSEMF